MLASWLLLQLNHEKAPEHKDLPPWTALGAACQPTSHQKDGEVQAFMQQWPYSAFALCSEGPASAVPYLV